MAFIQRKLLWITSVSLSRGKKSVGLKNAFWLFRRTISTTGITALYRADGTESAYSADCILALGDVAFEFTRTWPESVHFIGPALYTPPNLQPAPHFEAGRRHVLVTLGTHLAWHKDEVVKAVERLARTMPESVFHFTEGIRTRLAISRPIISSACHG